jgi:hypothetical protein
MAPSPEARDEQGTVDNLFFATRITERDAPPPELIEPFRCLDQMTKKI